MASAKTITRHGDTRVRVWSVLNKFWRQKPSFTSTFTFTFYIFQTIYQYVYMYIFFARLIRTRRHRGALLHGPAGAGRVDGGQGHVPAHLHQRLARHGGRGGEDGGGGVLLGDGAGRGLHVGERPRHPRRRRAPGHQGVSHGRRGHRVLARRGGGRVPG